MSPLYEFISSNAKQYISFVVLAGLLTGLTFGLGPESTGRYKELFFGLEPFSILVISSLLGFVGVMYLHKVHGFRFFGGISIEDLWFIVLTLVFALFSVLLDIAEPFSRDINVAYPESLLFYPSIALVAEIIFHVVPLATLLWLAGLLILKSKSTKQILTTLILVSAIEPVFQAFLLTGRSLWSTFLVTVNIFLFNLTQLQAFRRSGFLNMFLLRLIFYVIWHVAWGQARLSILYDN